MKLIDVSVIIPTYNRAKSLCETVDGIIRADGLPSELIVVDQSEDAKNNKKNFEERYAGIYSGEIIYIISDIPSLTRARNIGLSVARNDVIVFMDDDVCVENNTVSVIYDYLSKNDYSMVGILDKLAVPNGVIFPFIFGIRSFVHRKEGYVMPSMYGRYPTRISRDVRTNWAMGYCFAIKKSLSMKWKIFFDEKLSKYAYAEDLDFTYLYSKCSKREGLLCIITSKTMVAHNCSKEWRSSKKSESYFEVFNRLYLEEKHFGNMYARICFWWSNFGLLIKRIITRDNVADYLVACKDCVKYKKDIIEGNLHTELYQ